MISNPKPMASLSSGLLARKGQARPAMRPQGFVGLNPATAQDDLGWNDMGDDGLYPDMGGAPAPVGKPVVLRQREVLGNRFGKPADVQAAEPAAAVVVADVPAVEAPQVQTPAAEAPIAEAQAAQVSAPEPASVPVLPSAAVAQVVREVSARKTKAAFTLRLDQDRHLRLRLASVVSRRSAQQLVCQALDQFLESLTEVEALARQVGSVKDQG